MIFYIFFWLMAAIDDNFTEEFSDIYMLLIVFELLTYSYFWFFVALGIFIITGFIDSKYIGDGDIFFIFLPCLLLGNLYLCTIYFILATLFSLLNSQNQKSAFLFPSLLAFLLTKSINNI